MKKTVTFIVICVFVMIVSYIYTIYYRTFFYDPLTPIILDAMFFTATFFSCVAVVNLFSIQRLKNIFAFLFVWVILTLVLAQVSSYLIYGDFTGTAPAMNVLFQVFKVL